MASKSLVTLEGTIYHANGCFKATIVAEMTEGSFPPPGAEQLPIAPPPAPTQLPAEPGGTPEHPTAPPPAPTPHR
jgi:hypothetical protein